MNVWSRTLWVSLLVVGCVGKAPVDDTFDDLTAVDGKSDYFSSRLKMLGALPSGDSMAVPYTSTPRFRGLTVTAKPGDVVDIWARSVDGGDAVTWLLDDTFKVVAKNDDADSTTADSHIHLTLPMSMSKTYQVVLRDYYVKKHMFTVSFNDLTVAAPTAPDSGNTSLVHAFLPLYQAAGAAYATAPQVVAEASLPTAARTAFSDFVGSATTGTDVVAWRFHSGSATAYAVMMAFEGRYFVSLFNSTGRWISHGHVNDFANAPTIAWDLDIDDPSICRCGLSPQFEGAAGCSWVDGNNYNSDISDCD